MSNSSSLLSTRPSNDTNHNLPSEVTPLLNQQQINNSYNASINLSSDRSLFNSTFYTLFIPLIVLTYLLCPYMLFLQMFPYTFDPGFPFLSLTASIWTSSILAEEMRRHFERRGRNQLFYNFLMVILGITFLSTFLSCIAFYTYHYGYNYLYAFPLWLMLVPSCFVSYQLIHAFTSIMIQNVAKKFPLVRNCSSWVHTNTTNMNEFS